MIKYVLSHNVLFNIVIHNLYLRWFRAYIGPAGMSMHFLNA